VPTAPTVDTEIAYTLPTGTNSRFHVFYIPSSQCSLRIVNSSGGTVIQTGSFPIQPNGDSGYVPRGSGLPAGTYQVTATCSSSGGDETSPALTVAWT